MKIQNAYNVLSIQQSKNVQNTEKALPTIESKKASTQAGFSQGINMSDQTTQGLLQAQELSTESEVTKPKSAREQFLEYMKMTPEERLFYAFLKNKEGLSKEEFEALPPDEQQRIKEEIQKEIKEKIDTGQLKPEEMVFYT